MKPGVEYFLNFYAYQKNDEGLLKAGTELADAQVALPFFQAAKPALQFSEVKVNDGESMLTLSAKDMSAGFDKTTGALVSLKKGGNEMVKEGLRPNFWRPVTDNDMGNDMNKTLRPWREAGRNAKLVSMEQKALDDKTFEVISRYVLPVGESEFTVKYDFSAAGFVDVCCEFMPGNETYITLQ